MLTTILESMMKKITIMPHWYFCFVLTNRFSSSCCISKSGLYAGCRAMVLENKNDVDTTVVLLATRSFTIIYAMLVDRKSSCNVIV